MKQLKLQVQAIDVGVASTEAYLRHGDERLVDGSSADFKKRPVARK